MARKKHNAEQIVALLRQIEVELANHKSLGQACKEAGITEQTYYRWRKEYGGLKRGGAEGLNLGRRAFEFDFRKVHDGTVPLLRIFPSEGWHFPTTVFFQNAEKHRENHDCAESKDVFEAL